MSGDGVGIMNAQERPIKFALSFTKALEALAYVANRWDEITPFYVSKVMFFADKWHLNRYGRPVTGDTYIAMPRGPVPSTLRNIIEENFEWIEEPTNFHQMIELRKRTYKHVHSRVEDDKLTSLSETDKECLSAAVEFCRGKSLNELSALTHRERAWANAPANRAMDYQDFFDDEASPLIEEAREFAAYGVL
jgi:uncharacterized phage-associated protein